MRRAFLGLSVAGEHLSSKAYVAAFADLRIRFEEITFVIFDRLQIYNRIAKDSGMPLPMHLRAFQRGPRYVQDRITWIKRIAPRIPMIRDSDRLRILGVDDVTDGHCYRALRNLYLLFIMDQRFKDDIANWVHASTARWSCNGLAVGFDESLSTAYVLEEIAINLRIRVLRKIEAEYYPGKFPRPLLSLYKGEYSATVFELLETKPLRTEFRFFEYHPEAVGMQWISTDQCG